MFYFQVNEEEGEAAFFQKAFIYTLQQPFHFHFLQIFRIFRWHAFGDLTKQNPFEDGKSLPTTILSAIKTNFVVATKDP